MVLRVWVFHNTEKLAQVKEHNVKNILLYATK